MCLVQDDHGMGSKSPEKCKSPALLAFHLDMAAYDMDCAGFLHQDTRNTAFYKL